MAVSRIPDDIKQRIEEYDRNLMRWSHYEILYTTKNANAKEIKIAFRNIVRLMHPDKYGFDLEEDYKQKLERIFNEINNAYKVLSNESERVSYDRELYQADSTGKPLKVDTDIQVADAQYKRGIKALQKKELAPAIEFFKSAIQLNPEVPEYYAKLAFAHSQLPNPRLRKDGINICKEAIKRDSENPNYHALLGFLYQSLDDLLNAETNYRRALSWNPQHTKSRQELHKIAQLQKERSQKASLWGKISNFLKSKPNSPKSRSRK